MMNYIWEWASKGLNLVWHGTSAEMFKFKKKKKVSKNVKNNKGKEIYFFKIKNPQNVINDNDM